MHKLINNLPKLVYAVAIASPLLVASACTVHARVYDPYYHDYHVWSGETVYYNQWESETHRQHKDFNQRPADEQKQYWDWRHSHEQH